MKTYFQYFTYSTIFAIIALIACYFVGGWKAVIIGAMLGVLALSVMHSRLEGKNPVHR